jgi:hypothetical protein
MLKAEGKEDENKTGAYTEDELAGLSDTERAALEEKDDDVDALRQIAGAGDDDDDDGEDAAAKAEREKAEAAAAAAAKAKEDAAAKAAEDEARKKREAELAAMDDDERKKAEEADRLAAADAAERAKAEAKAKAEADASRGADDEIEPLVTTYHVAPPENYDARVKEIDERKAKATESYRSNEIDVDEMLRLHGEADRERRDLDNQKLKADMAAEMAEQQGAQRWQWEVNRFMKDVLKHEGIDYKKSVALNAALDAEVKRLANDEANKDKSGEWFLKAAHDNVKTEMGLKASKPEGDDKGGDAAAKAAAAAAAKAAAERRKQADANRDKLHRGISDLPAAGAGEIGNEGEFAHLEGLNGMELENAVARMTPDQQDRYART